MFALSSQLDHSNLPPQLQDNVRIFSAREQERMMDSGGSQSLNTKTLTQDPSFNQLTSNPDVYAYFNQTEPSNIGHMINNNNVKGVGS